MSTGKKNYQHVKTWRKKNPEKVALYRRTYMKKLRIACLNFYGGTPP